MAFRFLHLADVHLETRFGGRPRTRERLRAATLEAFARALEHASRERLHAVLVAGDLFEEELLSLKSELELVRRVRALAEAGTWFLYAAGNHDPGGPGTRAGRLFGDPALARVPSWRERVHFFDTRTPQAIVVYDERGEEVGVVLGAGHATDREAENLVARFHTIETGLPLVGLVHSQIESAGTAAHHERYAPSTRRDYERLPCEYFAVGHVHLRQQALPGLPVWYAGNLQGRNARETGAKGGLLVEVEAGVLAAPSFVPFAPVRWERVIVGDLALLRTAAALCDRLTEEIGAVRAQVHEELVVRVELRGPTPLHAPLHEVETRAALEDELAQRSGVLEVEIGIEGSSSARATLGETRAPSALAEALALLARARDDDELLSALAPERLAGFDEHALPAGADVRAARMAYLRERLLGLDRELARHAFPEALP